ncbi:hypothetical protein KUCAC02_034761 [Chaenocephalus aceratus]|nr:hypothetical protein KUCAC02_034761 [Chaenocephalus aceratus]
MPVKGGGRLASYPSKSENVGCSVGLQPGSPFEPVDPAPTWPCRPACAGSGGARCERSGLSAGRQQEVEEAL